MHVEGVRYALNGRPQSLIVKCFDGNSFQSLSLEILLHVGIILPSELACALVLPLMLVIFVPTYIVCGPGLMLANHRSPCLGSSTGLGGSHPVILVAVLLLSVLASLTRGFCQLELAKQLALTSREVVEEKVKRCAAEFQAERIQEGKAAPPTTSVASASDAESRAFTVLTAPPALLFGKIQDDPEEEHVHLLDSVDCLPEHCTVQIEGSDVPVAVGSLMPGDKVLCYDHLAQTAAFRKVTDVQAKDASTSQWLRVELTDGSCMDVTGDHPMKTTTQSQQNRSKGQHTLPATTTTTSAQDLVPKQHYLTCIRPVQLGIKNIRSYEELGEMSAARRISISVWQGERHSIFANLPGSAPSSLGAVAVGSADASFGFYTKNTFVHFQTPQRQLARSISDSNVNYLMDWSNPHGSNSISAYETSSKTSSASEDCVSKVRFPGPVSVQNHHRLGKNGLASIGSQHGSGCVPCKYHFRHVWFDPAKANGKPRPGPCNRGQYCNFCHSEEHDAEHRKYPPQSGRRKQQL
eukprot:TRINITY_DN9393_c0_g1_i1.p1 TRINITY_DN9393_c0_g1~~TRINITY_DN9393_c0_g1_i1.p1  ORF type:complete len:596 (-),score=89.11 TRINITY_DN9393_c0_g1_i1:17-1582(-)